MEGERFVKGLHVAQADVVAYARTLATLVVETDTVRVTFDARIERLADGTERACIAPASAADAQVEVLAGIHETRLPPSEQVARIELGRALAANIARELAPTTELPLPPWEQKGHG